MEKQGRTPFLATTPGVVLGCLVCCALWGSAFPCIKIGYELFNVASGDTASQLLFAGVRFTLSGIMVIVGTSLARREPMLPSRADIGPILTLAMFQTVGQYIFFYMGLSRASGTTSSILESSANFMAILLAALAFHTEHLTSRKIIGCLIGFAGVVLINLGGAGTAQGISFSLDGEGFVLISCVSAALSTCLIGIFSHDHDGVLLSGWQFLVGGAVLTAAGLLMGGHLAPQAIAPAVALIAYMAFISAMAYSMWARLLAVNPVSRVSVFGFMNPIFGFALSAIILGEGRSTNLFVAIAALLLVCAGIIVVNRPGTAMEEAGSPIS
ncbi:MAG: DMT family transporter [Coriobacteriaceae bacterium]|nr:DMT family transporter [Coriobacteriaceae bacterium]